MTKYLNFILLLLNCCLFGCVGDSGTSSTPPSISINDSSVIPVLSNTPITVYIHNNSNNHISGITYNIIQHAESEVKITNLAQCAQIAANSRCALLLSPPKLIDHSEDSILLKVNYANKDNKEISQFINFKKIDANQAGVFFAPTHPFIKDANTNGTKLRSNSLI